MPTADVTPAVRHPDADGESATGCAVCPHPWASHDRIAARFCTATAAGKFGRGCVCTAFGDDAANEDEGSR